MNYAILTQEITTDPLGSGYTAMSDQQVADALNVLVRPGPRRVLSAKEFLDACSQGEIAALQEAAETTNAAGHEAAAALDYYLSITGSIEVGDGAHGTTTVNALAVAGVLASDKLAVLRALAATSISRAGELGIEAVGDGHVRSVRQV